MASYLGADGGDDMGDAGADVGSMFSWNFW